jgi:hypothetical protein
MGIPDDPLERRKWMLQLWRKDYGERFSVFNPEDQPAPELDSWTPDMWEPYEPQADKEGNYDPGIVRRDQWFEETKRFLLERYQIAIGPDNFFDCKAGQYQGRFSDEVPPDKERLWYIRALRIGAFLFDGKWSVGFSCRSLSCQRKRCPLNLQRTASKKPKKTDKPGKGEKRWNRVDVFQLMQIFEGTKAMPMARAVEAVSKWFGMPLRGTFGEAYYAVSKESVYRQIKLYKKKIPELIKNFSNLCKRSPVVHFNLKPPSDEAYQDHFFFPVTMITADTLGKINSPAIITYLYLWMLRMEQLRRNIPKFELPTLADMERDAASRGFGISRRSIRRHIEQLNVAGLLDKFSGPIL